MMNSAKKPTKPGEDADCAADQAALDLANNMRAAWQRLLESAVEAGTVCAQARDSLSPAELAKLKHKIKMSDAAFALLVAIAQEPSLLCRAHNSTVGDS
jgi:hypothetical protein